VIALLGDGARALLRERIAEWDRSHSRRMLEDAIGRWRALGRTRCPTIKAAALAAGRHADPARIEALIEMADAALAGEASGGRRTNPVGLVLAGLGESKRSGGVPYPVPLAVAERWAVRRADSLKVLEAVAAVEERARRARMVLDAAASVGGST